MSWESESQFINVWMNELETAVYDLKLQQPVLEICRRLLTKAADAGLTGTGHAGSYTVLGCFYIACTMCGERVPLDRMLSMALWNGLKAKKITRTVDALIIRLGVRICSKCGQEAQSDEKFCQNCGTWLSRTIISLQELERCVARADALKGLQVRTYGKHGNERLRLFRLLDKYEKK